MRIELYSNMPFTCIEEAIPGPEDPELATLSISGLVRGITVVGSIHREIEPPPLISNFNEGPDFLL